jgi:alpha-1,6-mannosyltransferase
LLLTTSSDPGAVGDEVRDHLAASARPVRFVDTTMLYAPKSGGVKRYLTAKRAWLARNRPLVKHSLVVPGHAEAHDGEGLWSIYTAALPLADGYRLPTTKRTWCKRLLEHMPDLIEAGDPYTPGMAALMAGQKLGRPVVGFCHTDLGALAALHIGDWAEKPVRRKWAQIYSRFDRVVAPSRYMAGKLADEGVTGVVALPLGVDVQTFNPQRGDKLSLKARLGLDPDTRLLIFAGRPAREKRLDVLVEAVERLGDPYRLLLIGAGEGAPPSDQTLHLPYEASQVGLARLLAGCDAFVHANDAEPFGLIVLEAMACGLPVVGPPTGGIAESIDGSVGQLAARADSEAFAEAIAALFERDMAVVSRAARDRAVERHGWSAVFERLCAVYAEVSGASGFLPAQRLVSVN